MKAQQMIWKLSACACAVLLAACGSSGGSGTSTSSSNNVPPATNNSGSTQNTSSNSGSTQNTSNNSGNTQNTNTNSDGTQNTSNNSGSTTIHFGGIATKAIEDSKNDVFTEFGTQSNVSGSNLDVVVIDGKTINLVPHRIGGKWITTKDANEHRMVNTDLSYMRFGMYSAKQDGQDIYNINLIAHGQLTDASKVPTTGKATYVGEAVYGDSETSKIDALKIHNGWARGQAIVDVDYGAKNVAATITSSDRHFPSLNLKGTISGNTFSGVHDGYKMDGRFFGPNAEEVGGTFHKGTKDNPDVLGSFGAKKQ